MLKLPPMKYPNTQRTVSGTVDVFPDDVVLNCDTSSGEVTINLAEIPYDTTSGKGFWSTQYKLYINDISNNAGTNNITVIAGTGQTLNNQPTLVLNTNGASCYIMIAGNTEYSMFYAPAQALPPSFITVTSAQLSALITANNLEAGAFYNVTDAEFGSTPIIPTNIYIQALTNNTVSSTGYGYFYNADYQGVGDYAGIIGFTSQLGIWNQSLVTPLGSVVIWDNFHYINTTGVNTAFNPKADMLNWSLLAYSSSSGYIVEISSVSYRVSTNRILAREDLFGNLVERTILSGRNSLNFFKWGSIDVQQNNVLKESLVYNCNTQTSGLNSFSKNEFYDSEVIIGDGISQGGATTLWENNVFKKSTVSIPLTGGTITDNNFERLNLALSNSGSFTGNILINSNLVGMTNSGDITNNVFKDSALQILENTGFIYDNNIETSSFTIQVINEGKINSNNVSSSSSLSVVTNQLGAEIAYNKVIQNSIIAITNNAGKVLNNEVTSESEINAVNISSVGAIQANNVFTSLVLFNEVNSLFGTGAKGKGNVFLNNTFCRIGNYIPLTPSFYGNTLDGSIFDVGTFNGGFIANQLYLTEIFWDTLNGFTMGELSLSGLIIGNNLASLPETFLDGSVVKGLSSVSFILDCALPTVYDVATQTLTLPPEIATLVGNYDLQNASGITIAKIIGLSQRFNTTFTSFSGTVAFTSVAILGSAPNEIVSSTGVGTFNIVKHALVSDSITLQKEGNVCVVKDSNILL